MVTCLRCYPLECTCGRPVALTPEALENARQVLAAYDCAQYARRQLEERVGHLTAAFSNSCAALIDRFQDADAVPDEEIELAVAAGCR